MNIDLIKSLIKYDPNTGELFLRRNYRRRKAGKLKTYLDRGGYPMMALGGKYYHAHRVAWLLYYGEEPTQNISFVNGDTSDLAIKNLTKTVRQSMSRKEKTQHAITLIENGFPKSAVRILKELL